MALVLNEEQSMLRDSARGLISDKAPVAHLRKLRDTRDETGFSRELWKTFAEMGFAGLLVQLRRGRIPGDRVIPDLRLKQHERVEVFAIDLRGLGQRQVEFLNRPIVEPGIFHEGFAPAADRSGRTAPASA